MTLTIEKNDAPATAANIIDPKETFRVQGKSNSILAKTKQNITEEGIFTKNTQSTIIKGLYIPNNKVVRNEWHLQVMITRLCFNFIGQCISHLRYIWTYRLQSKYLYDFK